MDMTPKEKAKELISIHSITILSEVGNYLTINEVKAIARQCALISVDEILQTCTESSIWYWQEVKQEIEKL